MKILQVVTLVVAMAGLAFGQAAPAPEIGADGSTLVSALGIITGGLLILRSRRK